jgi:CSLREA domain-containing protein
MNLAGRTIFLVLITFCLATVVSAATFTVDSFNDTPDQVDGDGMCRDLFSACSFRAAIDEANALPGDDIIILPAGTYTQGTPVPDEDNNFGGDWDIRSNITITGAGQGVTILQASAAANTATERVLHSVLAANVVSITGVTIRHGKKAGATDDTTSGGGIFNAGTLAVNDSTVTANRVTGSGGGIYNTNHITLTNTTVSSNNCENTTFYCYGGGMLNYFTAATGAKNVTITGSTFAGNKAKAIHSNFSLGYSYGGGMGIETAAGVGFNLNISDSSFTGNQCQGFGTDPGLGGGSGGGIYAAAKGPSVMNISNTVVSSNSVIQGWVEKGGGIYLGTSGNLTGAWDKVTVAGNTANYMGNGISIDALGTSTTALDITNSTVSGNAPNFGAGWGGGITVNGGDTANLTVNFTNTTISGNRNAIGGGLLITNNFGSNNDAVITANFNFCTIAGNIADNFSANGGGLLAGPGPRGSVNLKNTVVADNTLTGGGTPTGPDISGAFISQDYNHIENTSGASFTPGPNDTTGTDPQLGPLQNNGGPTLTHLPAAGSLLLDSIPPGINGCGTTTIGDQRGFGRPFGSGCDKGAVERGATLAAGPWTLSGTVKTTTGQPIRNVAVTISGGNLPAPVTIFTGNFGTYQFTGLSGNDYTVTVTAKRFHFNDSLLVFSVGSNITNADFSANAPFSREVLDLGITPVKRK